MQWGFIHLRSKWGNVIVYWVVCLHEDVYTSIPPISFKSKHIFSSSLRPGLCIKEMNVVSRMWTLVGSDKRDSKLSSLFISGPWMTQRQRALNLVYILETCMTYYQTVLNLDDNWRKTWTQSPTTNDKVTLYGSNSPAGNLLHTREQHF